MNSDKFKRHIESMWKHRDTDEQKRLVKFTIAKTMRLTLEYPELAQEYFDSLCKVIPDNERITVSNYQHNLTSDAEGEELLTVKRSDVINEFDKLHKLSYKAADLQVGLNAFRTLFGSKCLPDEDAHEDNFATKKPKPAEPKNEGTRQEQCVPKNAESGTHLDRIVNNGFREHNRLHIAAMAMQGILSNADRMKGYEHVATTPPCEELTVVVARNALRYADALIKKVEGGSK